jgi:hypothetical protein
MSEHDVIEVITDEPSRVHRIPMPPSQGDHLWRWAALVLSTIAAAVALAGGLGRLLYVTRSEYTEDAKLEAVTRENMRGTLERLDRTLNTQAAAFDRMSSEVQTVKVDLAVVAKKR